jgi:hypothetical protein
MGGRLQGKGVSNVLGAIKLLGWKCCRNVADKAKFMS